jgi:uncharacterized protein DUF6982
MPIRMGDADCTLTGLFIFVAVRADIADVGCWHRRAMACRPVPSRAGRGEVMNKVVARFADGRLIKGVSMNVDITKPTCHVRTAEGRMEEVRLADLKALFFVKSLDGDSAHNEAMAAEAADPRSRGSIQVELRFRDGERLVAFANRFPPLGAFFFLVPVDAKSNNIRILVNRAQVVSIDRFSNAA